MMQDTALTHCSFTNSRQRGERAVKKMTKRTTGRTRGTGLVNFQFQNTHLNTFHCTSPRKLACKYFENNFNVSKKERRTEYVAGTRLLREQ
mmetsp:Transcript_67576/g.180612  ORF Transcript_67576/g.180612 Transcript_67576/m.180612 type:complete len:91 (+) Transcript_67576:343-615(+)